MPSVLKMRVSKFKGLPPISVLLSATDYGHTKAKSLILCDPNSNPNPKKMGADSLAENIPNAPEFICPICLSKSKKSGFQLKKASLGVCSPRANTNIVMH